MACQTSAQRHGRDGDQGAAEPHRQQHKAPVPSISHGGLPTGQPEEHQDAERTQLQAWRKGLSLFSSMFTKCLHKFFVKMNQQSLLHLSFFIDLHTEGIRDGVGQVRPLQ